MDSLALHTVARRYLMKRYDELTREYAALPNDGRADDGLYYQPEVWRIFLRYHVVAAILVEVERLDPERLPAPNGLIDALVEAVETLTPRHKRGTRLAA